MGILTRLSGSSMVGRPFCDYLNVSFPSEQADDLRARIQPLLDGLGCFDEPTPGLLRFLRLVLRRGKAGTETLGTVKFGRRGRVGTLSLSGGVLRLLRESGGLPEFLATVAVSPHRVTMLHATADFLCEDVPSYVNAVKDAAYGGSLSLTRKRILPSQCQHVFGMDCDGRETGTVYLGQRANADVWAKVYDKRHERLSKGYAEPGSLARIEVACMSDTGVTLRDALDPYDVFCHFAGRSLVEAPASFGGWLPHGEGFVLGERRERTLFEKFDLLIAGSLDIRRAAEMAVALYGLDVAPQALGRKLVALVKPLGVGFPENAT